MTARLTGISRDAPYAASLVIEVQDEWCARGIWQAILPETARPPSRRSRVTVAQEGRRLFLEFKAEDTVALRASLNSYLRWACAVKNAYESLRKHRLAPAEFHRDLMTPRTL